MTPCFLCDSHGSRFSLEFLERVNDKDHPFNGMVGCPYFTHAYQVHDSSEANGAFKSNWYKEKDQLIQWKSQHGYSISLGKTDIMPLLNRAAEASFGNTGNAKKVISSRGWNPLNYSCLTLKEVLATKRSEPTAAGTTTGSVDTDSNSPASSPAAAAPP